MSKNIALALLLIVPVLIVIGLYRLGRNTYRVPEGRYTGRSLTLSQEASASADTTTPVIFRFMPEPLDPTREQQLSDRFYHRLRQASERGGVRVVHLLGDEPGDGASSRAGVGTVPTYPLPVARVAMPAARQYRLADSLLDIRPAGALAPGMIFALTDGQGRLQNVYDLSRSELQDTLLIETLIVAGAR